MVPSRFRVQIFQENDGFQVTVTDLCDNEIKTVRISQEETVQELTEIFEAMEIPATFEEVY